MWASMKFLPKLVSDNPGLVDFAVSLVDSVSHLHDWIEVSWEFIEEIQTTVLSTVRENQSQSKFNIQL